MSSGQFSPEPVDERGVIGEMLSLPALEVRQGEGRVLYSFAVDGKKLPLFAAVSRIHRVAPGRRLSQCARGGSPRAVLSPPAAWPASIAA